MERREESGRHTQRPRSATIVLIQLALGAAVAGVFVLLGTREGDPLVFLSIADRVAAGEIPYRDFPVEYPPLALLPLVLPRLAAGPADPEAYQLLFSAASLLQAVVIAVAVVWLARKRWSATSPRDALLTFMALTLAALPLVIWRFDIFPALFVTLAVVSVALASPAWAGVMLGLGTAAKIYPAFLVPVLVGFYLLHRRLTPAVLVVGGFAIAFGAVVAQAMVVAGIDALSYLTHQDDRGVEIESVVGGLVLLSNALRGTEATIAVGFGAWQVTSSVIDDLQIPRQVFEVVLLTGLLACGWLSYRRDIVQFGAIRPTTLLSWLFATLVMLILTNKVLSPQYLIWLLPFGALAGRFQSTLLLVICALTTIVYPLNFDSLIRLDPTMIFVLNARNALLVVLYFAILVPIARSSGLTLGARPDAPLAPREPVRGQPAD